MNRGLFSDINLLSYCNQRFPYILKIKPATQSSEDAFLLYHAVKVVMLQKPVADRMNHLRLL